MGTVIAWAIANPFYGFAALVGFTIGVFYGFDGWRGSSEELDLKDSPRVKNLLWVIGPAAAAAIGDVKAISPGVVRSLLLFVYFIGFLTGSIAVVLGWGVVVAISRTLARRHGQNFGYSVSDSIGDYFFYGYRSYRKRAEAAQAAGAAGFHAEYLTQLAYAITAAGSVTGTDRLVVVRSILRSITAVVKAYRRATNEQQIKSNVMLLEECGDNAALRERLCFVGQQRPTVTRCLVLRVYDTNEGQPELVLPLPPNDDVHRLLPGAPKAMIDDSGIDVVDDTSKVAFPTGLPEGIREEMRKYFRAKRFRSFASLRIVGRGGHVGVVNVEAGVVAIFGTTDAEKSRIAQYLLPFCSTLGIILSDGL